MRSLYLIAGILALSLFAYANVQGWSLFHSTGHAHGPGYAGAGRPYHK
jgi:hypothetical protein